MSAFLLGMNGMPNPSAPSEAPFRILITIIYAFVILSFVVVNSLLLFQRENERFIRTKKSLFILFQLTFCGLLGAFEFWIKLGIKDYYRGMLGTNALLPPSTQFVLYSIPSGTLTILMLLLSAGIWWNSGIGSKSKMSHQTLAQIVFLIVGAFILIFAPHALLAPYLY